MTSIILAGGRSSRFGQSKAFETIHSKSLIQWVIDRLTPLCKEIIVVTAQEDCFASPSLPLRFARSFGSGLRLTAMTYHLPSKIRMVADIYPGKGSLGGIYTGLTESSCSHAIIVGCDMPFLSVALLDYMTQLSPTFDAVVPRIEEMVEPLCAVYSKNCLVPIQLLLERNELRISELFSVVRVKYVEEDEIDRFDPEHLSFFNINTKADLDKARRLAAEKGLADGKY